MSSDLQLVGSSFGALGTFKPFTAGPSGSQRTNDAHGRYLQAAIENRLFFIDSGSITLASTHVTKSAMGTATFINGFYNPAGSNKYVGIVGARIGTVSGTPGGPFFYNYLCNQNLTSASTGTVQAALLAASSNSSGVTPQVNVALVDTPASTQALTQLGVVGGPAAVAAGAGLYGVIDEVAGAIIVPPGCVFGIMCTAAGTSHVVQSTLILETLPANPMNAS